MEFYQAISKHYDAIFPLGEAQLKLLSEEFAGKNKILDLACGTGTYALALGAKGFQVYGLDLDASMVAEARSKAAKERAKVDVDFLVADMRDCAELFSPKSFGGIFCIGNSLVHLPSKEHLGTLVKNVFDLLEEGGVFISQIVNYDRVLHYGITELPVIHNRQAGVRFIRKYKYNEEHRRIIFSGTLEVEGEKPVTNSVTLLPLLKDEMIAMHQEAGFKQIETFGGFRREPFTLDTQALVVVARK
ncbi:class I SAM-dependent methyltransferase [Zhaonella formicivorans]|uniref:class I SAM-dependent methyltransferase n=1 Tax=Zhaonella formicivorans TaxID=2528593 RepID=UPI001D1132E2|nr:class I SAM-dependent methyltransferase [Zhaonella formicivorans]